MNFTQDEVATLIEMGYFDLLYPESRDYNAGLGSPVYFEGLINYAPAYVSHVSLEFPRFDFGYLDGFYFRPTQGHPDIPLSNPKKCEVT